MPSTLFDSAGLAIVAYVQVDGTDGSSNSTALANSGVTTTKVPGHTGDYLIQLSTALGQDPSRDLIFVQPTLSTAIDLVYPPAAIVVDGDDYTKEVLIGTYNAVTHGTTALDCDFNVLILRTILP
jgi:hypothetical protein